MKNIFKFEFIKLIKHKSFYICAAVILAIEFLSLMLQKQLSALSGSADGLSVTSVLLSAIDSSGFTMICGIFIALFTCADYTEQTIKNIYSHGFSKTKVCFSKFITVVTATLVMFAATIIFSFACGNAMFGRGDDGNCAGLLFGQLLMCIAHSAFVFAISIAVKKGGVSIACAILGPSLVGILLSFIDASVKSDGFSLAKYWLSYFSGDLSTLSTSAERLTICSIFCIIYTVMFTLIACLINKKQEH